jgi:hypothetical protein
MEGEMPQVEQNGLVPVLKVDLTDNTLYYDYKEVSAPPRPLQGRVTELEEELATTQALLDQAEQEQANLLLSLVEGGIL